MQIFRNFFCVRRQKMKRRESSERRFGKVSCWSEPCSRSYANFSPANPPKLIISTASYALRIFVAFTLVGLVDGVRPFVRAISLRRWSLFAPYRTGIKALILGGASPARHAAARCTCVAPALHLRCIMCAAVTCVDSAPHPGRPPPARLLYKHPTTIQAPNY